jgi:hypothetical protein
MGKVLNGQWEIMGTNNPAATLRRMDALTRQDSQLPDSILAANSIVMTADGHSNYAMAQEIKEWCQQHFHYIPDLDEMQVLKSPHYLLQQAQKNGVVPGNCADAAMLSAMLCICDGIPCYFEARAFIKPDNPYQHVVAVAQTEKGLVDFDITKPSNIGDIVISRRYRVKV